MDCINLINVEKLLFLLQRASNTFHLSKHKTNNFLPTYSGVTKIDRNHTDTHTHTVSTINKQSSALLICSITMCFDPCLCMLMDNDVGLRSIAII